MIFGCCRFWMLRTFDALIVTPMRGSFLPRSYRSIYQPRGIFSTVLLKSVAVCFYAPCPRPAPWRVTWLCDGPGVRLPPRQSSPRAGPGPSKAEAGAARADRCGSHSLSPLSHTGPRILHRHPHATLNRHDEQQIAVVSAPWSLLVLHCPAAGRPLTRTLSAHSRGMTPERRDWPPTPAKVRPPLTAVLMYCHQTAALMYCHQTAVLMYCHQTAVLMYCHQIVALKYCYQTAVLMYCHQTAVTPSDRGTQILGTRSSRSICGIGAPRTSRYNSDASKGNYYSKMNTKQSRNADTAKRFLVLGALNCPWKELKWKYWNRALI